MNNAEYFSSAMDEFDTTFPVNAILKNSGDVQIVPPAMIKSLFLKLINFSTN